jgi:hypothetical protein
MARLSMLALLVLAIFAPAACKEQEPAKASPKKNSTSSSGDNDNSSNNTQNTNSDPCENSGSSSSSDDVDEDDSDEEDELSLRIKKPATGLGLVEEVTYDDIESILSSKCTSCHNSSVQQPDLSSYNKAKTYATDIKTSIENGSMPPTGGLTSSEKTKIKDWVSGGMLENSNDTNDDDDDSSSDTSDCDTTGSSDPLSKAQAMEELMNPAKLKECHDAGKVYDRGKDKCHISTLVTSSCTIDGITKSFKAVGVTLPVSGSSITGFEGYEIDQCGEYNGDPIAFFYKKVDDVADEVTLQIKLLCKKGSPSCAR